VDEVQGGAVKFPGYIIKSKYTRALSCYLSIRMLRELKRIANKNGKRPCLEIEFSGHMYYPPEKWVMIPAEEFRRLAGVA
jgi:hypothetical protein